MIIVALFLFWLFLGISLGLFNLLIPGHVISLCWKTYCVAMLIAYTGAFIFSLCGTVGLARDEKKGKNVNGSFKIGSIISFISLTLSVISTLLIKFT